MTVWKPAQKMGNRDTRLGLQFFKLCIEAMPNVVIRVTY